MCVEVDQGYLYTAPGTFQQPVWRTELAELSNIA